MDTGYHLFSVDAYSRAGRFVPGPVACDRSYALPGHPTRGAVHRFSAHSRSILFGRHCGRYRGVDDSFRATQDSILVAVSLDPSLLKGT